MTLGACKLTDPRAVTRVCRKHAATYCSGRTSAGAQKAGRPFPSLVEALDKFLAGEPTNPDLTTTPEVHLWYSCNLSISWSNYRSSLTCLVGAAASPPPAFCGLGRAGAVLVVVVTFVRRGAF